MNKLRKILSVIQRWIIQKEVFFSVDKYNRDYIAYLKKIGVKFSGPKQSVKFIANDVYFDGHDYSLISIGDNVTISKEVMLLTHDYSLTTAMSSIGKGIINRHEGELYILKEITIGNNCFIGARSSLLPGTKIGDNCIIGACSVVKGVVPENSIVVGNPAKIIGDTREFANKHILAEDYLIEK